jgi:hypothetical protein
MHFRMKIFAAAVVLTLAALPTILHGQPASQADFTAAVRSAIQEKSWPKMLALTYTVGLSASDKLQMQMLQHVYFGRAGIADMSFEPFPQRGTGMITVMGGKKWEPTYPPAGLLKITFQNTGSGGPISFAIPYAIIDGHYFLTASKSTDLGWKGPPDHGLTVMAMSTSPGGISLDVKWNASGVEQERTTPNVSLNMMGQYIEHVTATCTNNTGTTTLTITDAGKDIYHSQPLTGKGTLEYTKPAN